MLYISHRGNTFGRDPDLENTWDYIYAALETSDMVEVDVWSIEDEFYLGHDDPFEKIDGQLIREFGTAGKFIYHAKNREALERLLEMGVHCFWHESDECTLTSENWIWEYPIIYNRWGKPIAICSDYKPDWMVNNE